MIRLARGGRSVKEIANRLGVGSPAVYKHLKVVGPSYTVENIESFEKQVSPASRLQTRMKSQPETFETFERQILTWG